MQATRQKVTTKAVTATQSFEAVKTLITAGLGCITFLRDLLPEDNFTQTSFAAFDDSFAVSADGRTPTPASAQKQGGFKIMTISRGSTEEADRLLNYLENGIYDALQKQYLKSFIFAIYLVKNDMQPIVEAYTFNFEYHQIPGTDTTIPIMTLDETMKKMSIRNGDDALRKTLKQGKVPTFGEVKSRVKVHTSEASHLLRAADGSFTEYMRSLLQKRYANFKVFYTEAAPSDYEPPGFKPGDVDKDRWYIMTHAINEAPERWSMGKLDAGHHRVKLNVTSISSFLPSSTENDNSPFAGPSTRSHAAPALTPAQEFALRAQQSAKQAEDAARRNVAWALDTADAIDPDADGDVDEEYDASLGGLPRLKSFDDSGIDISMIPVGLRNEQGIIEPIPPKDLVAHYGGDTQDAPRQLEAMNVDRASQEDVPGTQLMMTPTQTFPVTPMNGRNRQIRPTGLESVAQLHPLGSLDLPSSLDIDTQMLQDMNLDINGNTVPIEETEILNLETQRLDDESQDHIQSFSSREASEALHTKNMPLIDNGLKCECGVQVEDDDCVHCEGACGHWYHIWCMGYHTKKDRRLPDHFVCFDCRAREDVSWALVERTVYPRMHAKFRDLAVFRRAIKKAELMAPTTTPQNFAKVVNCDQNLGRSLFTRLRGESFVSEQLVEVDALGVQHSRAAPAKVKGKAASKSRKNAGKRRWVFNHAMKDSTAYKDYFDPNPAVERRILKFEELEKEIKLSRKTPFMESTNHALGGMIDETQTQEDTQMWDGALKRGNDQVDDSDRPKKKTRISVAFAVDLAE
ncbi:HORMA domain-containing protein [Schizophyllum fasciatum]